MLLTLVVVLPVFAMAQFTIKGKVTDAKTGEELPGASVFVENTLKSTITSPNGRFSINLQKNGKYTVTVTYVGYEPSHIKIDSKNNKELDIKLNSSIYLQDEVIIQGTRANEKTPMAVQNITKREIKSLNLGQDIPFLISSAPSVVTTSDAGAGVGYTGMRIRGTDMNRINVTLNGIPLNDAESHGVYWVDLPDFASSVDNLQIQRGVGTSTNGAGAFGASINLQTSKPSSEAFAEVSQSFGSFNTRKTTVSAGTGILSNHWSVEARASQINSDGYVDRASSNLISLYGSAAYYGLRDLFKFTAFSGKEITYQSWNGIPFDSLKTNRRYNSMGEYTDTNGKTQYYNNEVDNYKQDNFQVHYSHEFSKHLLLNTALHYTKGFGYYEEYKENQFFQNYGLGNILVDGTEIKMGNEIIPVINGKIDSTNLIRRKYLDNDFYGMSYSLLYTAPTTRFTFGGSNNSYFGKSYGQIIWAQFASDGAINHQWYYSTGDKKDYNMYAKLEQKLGEKINLYVDMQYRIIDYKIKGTDTDLRNITQSHYFNFFNPKVGLFADLNENNNIYASFAVAHREPNRDNFVDANPLKPEPKAEELNDLEMGWNIKSQSFNFNANFYYMYYNNQLVLTGQINDVGNPVMENVSKSYRMGLELISKVNINKHFSWNGNITFSRNKIENFTEYVDDWDTWGQKINSLGTTDLAFSPNTVAFQQLTYAPVQNLSFSFESKYVGKQFIDNTSSNDRILHSFFVNNFRTEYHFKTKFARLITLNLALNNLFSEKYETNAWVYRYYEANQYKKEDGYFPQAGFNLMAGVTIKF
jgi:iron complex outermembrane receptor protein